MLVHIADFGAAVLAVLGHHLFELADDDFVQLLLAAEDLLHLGDLRLQGLDLAGAGEDVLPVEVAQLDFGHVVGLDLVDAKADHQVGDDLLLLPGLPHDADGLVDVQQDLFEPQQQVQPGLFLLQIEIDPAADALPAKGRPLLQQLPHPHHPGRPGDEDVEVAGEVVLQGGHPVEFGHQLVRLHPAL